MNHPYYLKVINENERLQNFINLISNNIFIYLNMVVSHKNRIQ